MILGFSWEMGRKWGSRGRVWLTRVPLVKPLSLNIHIGVPLTQTCFPTLPGEKRIRTRKQVIYPYTNGVEGITSALPPTRRLQAPSLEDRRGQCRPECKPSFPEQACSGLVIT